MPINAPATNRQPILRSPHQLGSTPTLSTPEPADLHHLFHPPTFLQELVIPTPTQTPHQPGQISAGRPANKNLKHVPDVSELKFFCPETFALPHGVYVDSVYVTHDFSR
jgi:hypothetical protein